MTLTSTLLKLAGHTHRVRAAVRRRTHATKAAAEHRAEFYRQAWCEAAARLGADVFELGDGLLGISTGGVPMLVRGNETSLDHALTLAVAGNKPLVYRLLAEQGLPIPRHLAFTLDEHKQAAQFLKHINAACVVKPARDTGAGHGVTTGVRNRLSLLRAAAYAAGYGRELLLEEQLPGDVHRLLYLDGELLDAVVRRRPQVAGDGESTVRQLIDAANRQRVECGTAVGQTLLTLDLDTQHTLAQQGLKLSSVPEAGRMVTVKSVSNENAGHENECSRDWLCNEVIAAGAAAARAIGSRLAGVDVLTPDPSRPLHVTGGAILEVNTTPGYYYHYHRRGEPARVAIPILKRMLEQSTHHCLDAATA